MSSPKQKRRFDPNIGKAHWFRPGHKLGGRPRTKNLLRAAEHVARECGVDLTAGLNAAQELALYCHSKAMKGSPRHAEIFFRLLKEPLRAVLEDAGFEHVIVSQFCKLQKTRTVKATPAEQPKPQPACAPVAPRPIQAETPKPETVRPRLAPEPVIAEPKVRSEADWYDELLARENAFREAQGLPALRTRRDGERINIGESFGV